MDAGQEGGGGGGDQVQLAPRVLGSEEEDGRLGGGEVPCDGAGGEGEGGEEEGRCRWRCRWRLRFASCLTTSGTEERGRTEEGAAGGGEEERADFSALHRFSPLQIVLLHVAARLAPGCHDLGPEQGFHGGGSAGQGEGGDGEDEDEQLHRRLSQVDCDIDACSRNPYSKQWLTGEGA